jgi:hypothetical protein
VGNRQRYDLILRRLDGNNPTHEVPERVIEFFDLDDDHEVEPILGRHFAALASAAAGEQPQRDPDDMPWLAEYVLDVCEHNRTKVEFSYRGTPPNP